MFDFLMSMFVIVVVSLLITYVIFNLIDLIFTGKWGGGH